MSRTTITCKCECCKTLFQAVESYVRLRGGGRFCSNKCAALGRAQTRNQPSPDQQLQMSSRQQRAAHYPTESWWACRDADFSARQKAEAARIILSAPPVREREYP